MDNKVIDEQNELNYLEAWFSRSDMKDKDPITKLLLWYEDRNVAQLSWRAIRRFNRTTKKEETVTVPFIDGVNPDRYAVFMGIQNKWYAELARRASAKNVRV